MPCSDGHIPPFRRVLYFGGSKRGRHRMNYIAQAAESAACAEESNSFACRGAAAYFFFLNKIICAAKKIPARIRNMARL